MRVRSAATATAAVVLVSLSACSVGTGSRSQSSDQIVLITSGTVYKATGAEAGLVKEFEDSTGIKVQVVTAEVPSLYEKENAAFTGSSAAYDVVAFDDSASTPDLWQNLAPLDKQLDAAGTDFDPDDFIDTGAKTSQAPDGTQYGIPLRLSAYIIYYRKDLLAQAGYTAFPTTWDELMAAVKKISNGNVAGMMQRGASPDSAVDFMSILASYNGQLLDDAKQKCTLDSPNAVQAATMFVELFQKYAPQGAVAAGRDDYTAAYQQGRSAMSVFTSSYYSELIDPKSSKVSAADTGAALTPAANGAPVGASRIAAWSLGIPKKSKKQDEAWQLIQFLTNPANQLKAALEYGNGPSRASVYQSPEYAKTFPPAQTVLDALKVARPDPATPDTAAMRTLVAGQLSAAILGQKSPQQAMVDSCTQINQLLK